MEALSKILSQNGLSQNGYFFFVLKRNLSVQLKIINLQKCKMYRSVM